MSGDSHRRYNYRLFDLAKVTEYAVEASGVRSPVYRLDIADLAFVKRVDLEYRYPAYTQLPIQRVDSTGDIAALQGHDGPRARDADAADDGRTRDRAGRRHAAARAARRTAR